MSVPTAAASVSSGAAAAAAAAARKLPLFFAYCPDAPDALAKRLEVRPRHWERWQRDKERGLGFFGLGYLPPSGSPLRTSPLLPPNTPPMAGSLMILRAKSLDDAWERIRSDVYWTEGVWDRGQVKVEEFIRHAEYNYME